MDEKVCMVTGSNSGIGYVTTKEIAKYQAQIVMVCRNKEKGQKAQKKIIEETNNSNVDLLIADFSSQASIRSMVKEFRLNYDKLNILINNAGTFQSKRTETDDGLETTFGVNHIGPFLLTNLLLDTIKDSATSENPARIINVSSALHTRAKIDFNDLQTEQGKYNGMNVYGDSKLCNILFTYELHHQLREEGIEGINVNAVHPGFIRTNLGRDGGNFFQKCIFSYLIRPLIAKSPAKGAETSIYLAISPEIKNISGKYFTKKEAIPSSKISYNRELQKQLWNISEQLVEIN